MTLPSFIGIGAERCGTTWLHLLLRQHPKVYMPSRRKELDFFNRNYDKGREWYESFFPDPQDAVAYKAIGEISPGYLGFPEAAERMASVQSIRKLIAILRNPVDRAYSHYGHAIRLRGYDKSFEEFLNDHPDSLTHGFYAKNLERFLKYYSRDQLCCLIFEEAINDIASTKKDIAQFLEINPHEFPDTAVSNKTNETYIPKFKKLNRSVTQISTYLRNSNLDWLVNLAKTAGFQKVLKIGAVHGLPPMRMETRLCLQETYARDTETLENLLGINLDIWRN
jgi:hypothetical protein